MARSGEFQREDQRQSAIRDSANRLARRMDAQFVSKGEGREKPAAKLPAREN